MQHIARTDENVDVVESLVLSEDNTNGHVSSKIGKNYLRTLKITDH